jgi:uncharacterized protein
MKIEVVYCPAPRQIRQWELELADGSSLAQALERCTFFTAFSELDANNIAAGVWGKRVGLDRVLEDRDRVEIYRALRVDPKTARRERFSKQGYKGTGLFASTRPGAKAGY